MVRNQFYADYNTGHAWPGMRTIGEKLGISKDTVQRAIESLQKAHMVRIVQSHSKRRGQTYIARERMCIRLGSRIICTIVFDYIPHSLRGRISRIENALKTGEIDEEAFSEVEVIPGQGFEGITPLRRFLHVLEHQNYQTYQKTTHTEGWEKQS